MASRFEEISLRNSCLAIIELDFNFQQRVRSLIGKSSAFYAREFLLRTISIQGCGSPVVRVSDHGRYVMSSSPVPLKTRRVRQRCTLNLSRAETSSRWCGVVVRRGGASSGVVHVT
ncbi:uncharacterized protein TNCV_3565571 [Trichonephila clavipes]|nr:uncharacterized protein TNCV_3565571 [Trichonephila clavipes]